MTDETAVRWRRRLTIPNALALFRMLCAPLLLWLAVDGHRAGVVTVFVLMAASDWVDGRIARRFNQRSDIGPRLDSIADLVMYVSLLVGAVILDRERLIAQWPWIVAPFVAYLTAGALGLARFGRWPHHHPRLAKIAWGLMLVGATVFLAGGSPWPLRLALTTATLASLQSMLITHTLVEWRDDVSSVAEARRLRRDHGC